MAIPFRSLGDSIFNRTVLADSSLSLVLIWNEDDRLTIYTITIISSFIESVEEVLHESYESAGTDDLNRSQAVWPPHPPASAFYPSNKVHNLIRSPLQSNL